MAQCNQFASNKLERFAVSDGRYRRLYFIRQHGPHLLVWQVTFSTLAISPWCIGLHSRRSVYTPLTHSFAEHTWCDTMARLQTVVELPEFQRRARAIMSEHEREVAINYVAANPEAGISLGGGLRKVRIPREGSGKSGGFRTIYVFGGTHMPIFLITVFAKNEKSNLSKTEQAAAAEMSKALVAKYGDVT